MTDNDDSPANAALTPLLCFVYLVSGASALVFATVWFYQAGLAIGNSVWGSSLVLIGFLGGLALGNAAAVRRGDRFSNPVRTFALLQIAIAVSGIALALGLPDLAPLTAALLGPLETTGWLANLGRFAVAFSLLLVPAASIGLTLPLLTRALCGVGHGFGPALGHLHGWNAAGAALGVLAAEAILIPSLGVRATAFTAGGLSLAASAVALWLSSGRAAGDDDRGAATEAARWSLAGGSFWLISAALNGFALIALTLIWFRLLSLYSVNSSSIDSAMLAIVFAGIALGSTLAGSVLRRWPDAHRFSLALALAAGGLSILTYRSLPFFVAQTELQTASSPTELALLAIPLMLPVAALSGAFFTFAGAALREELRSAASTTGALAFAHILGAALGAVIGPFVLLPALGLERSLYAVALVYAGIGALLFFRSKEMSIEARTMWSAAFVLCIALFPYGAMEHIHVPHALDPHGSPPARDVSVREGSGETLFFVAEKRMGRTLQNRIVANSSSISETGLLARRHEKLRVYWPAAIHPELESALLIGYGAGAVAEALAATESLETIDVVEVSREVLATSELAHPDPTEDPLRDPRMTVHVGDGRYFLQATRRSFDLITVSPPPPDIAGATGLYTQEFFELAYDRLAEGGIATYPLPVGGRSDTSTRAIIAAFCGAFQDCSLWNGMGPDLMLVGGRDLAPATRAAFERQWNDEGVRPELVGLGFERPEQLGALFIGDVAYLSGLVDDAPPLTDDRPRLISAPTSSEEREQELFASLRDSEAARERFRASPFVASLWPPELIDESLAYFQTQWIINAIGWGDHWKWPHRFDAARYILSQTPLEVVGAWPLSSHRDLEQIGNELAEAGRVPGEAHLHLGIAELSRRNYEAASEHLALATQATDIAMLAVATRIFAVAMSGDIDTARAMASLEYLRLGSSPNILDYWDWLRGVFGIDATIEPD